MSTVSNEQILMLVTLSLFLLLRSAVCKICDDSYECSTDTITDVALCDGFLGCYQATIDASYAECNGFYSCSEAKEISTSIYVNCRGAYSCYNAANIKAVTYVQCNGLFSCAFTKIESLTNTNCTAQSSCYASTITAGNHVICDGKSSCAHTQLSVTQNAYCVGEYACSYAVLTVHDYVYVYGHYGAQYSTISAQKVFGYGADALRDADLDSINVMEMTVYSYGYQSGYDAHFICRSGSICNLYCAGNGCNGMELICLFGATCTVSPLQCASNSDINGIDCPIQTVSLSMKDDEKAMQFMEDKKKKKSDTHVVALEKQFSIDIKPLKHEEMQFMIWSTTNIELVLLIGGTSSVLTFVFVYCYLNRKYQNNKYALLV